MLRMEFKGVKRKLEDLSRRAKELDGSHEIILSELMPPEFVSGCSKFSSLQELFTASGFKIDSIEDFKAIPDDEWDAFIQGATPYENWEEMNTSAIRVWTRKKLSL
jgi:hypothetical protein